MGKFKEAKRHAYNQKICYRKTKSPTRIEAFALSSGNASNGRFAKSPESTRSSSFDSQEKHHSRHFSPKRLVELSTPRKPRTSVKEGQSQTSKIEKRIPMHLNALFQMTGEIKMITDDE